MKKEEFIKWLEENSIYDGRGDFWELLVDYADCIKDYLDVNENTVTYRWEERYWGGSNQQERELTFEEFIEAYEDDTIKY